MSLYVDLRLITTLLSGDIYIGTKNKKFKKSIGKISIQF